MQVTVEFPFDAAEHRRASFAVMRTLPSRWIGPMFAVPPLAFGLWTVLAARRDVSTLTVVASALPWLLVALTFAFLTPIAVWATARRIARHDPSARGVQMRHLDATGFRSTGNGVGVEVPWHAIQRCVETEGFFLFFYTKQLAYYLGKSRLSAEQCDVVRSLIATHAASAGVRP